MSPTKPTPEEKRPENARVYRAWLSHGDRRGKSQRVSPIVTVFGAGIAGLSTAHELIERGFSVQVVEPTYSPDQEYGVEVGGLARNQFGRVPENPLVLHQEDAAWMPRDEFQDNVEKVLMRRTTETRRVQRRFPVPFRIVFDRARADRGLELNKPDEWGVTNRRKLFAVWQTLKEAYRTYKEELARQDRERSLWYYAQELPRAWKCRETLYVEVRGHTDGDHDEIENRELSGEWAADVIQRLKSLNEQDDFPIPEEDFLAHFKCVAVGSAEPVGDKRDDAARQRSNRVEFRIVEEFIPGEHGYRFFPAFYRHLFDTMRRTPILDQNNHETGQTAYDRLVPTREFGLAPGDGAATASIQTRPPRSLEELRKHSELFLKRLGVTQRDIARFQVRILKFLTSSSERRRLEYEDQSWWTFIGGDAERGYSERMERYLKEAPQALVAMDATETDARSQGNIVSQIQLRHMESSPDRTLNGPTSQVWLREWKRYLQRQGVRFFHGELARLDWFHEELIPLTGLRSGWLEASGTVADPGSATDVQTMAWPPAIPRRAKVDVEVLESDDGDYTVRVGKNAYTVTAHRASRQRIAKCLAKAIDKGQIVAAKVSKRSQTRIVITERREVRLEISDQPIAFDDSLISGTWQRIRRIRRQELTGPVIPAKQLFDDIERGKRILAAANNLRDKLPRANETSLALGRLFHVVDGVNASCDFRPLFLPEFKKDLEEVTAEAEKEALMGALKTLEDAAGDVPKSARRRPRQNQRASNVLLEDDSMWVHAGRLRAADPAFDGLLSSLEMIRRPRRELVPRLTVSNKQLLLSPPAWVDQAEGLEDNDTAATFAPLFPYYFRTRQPSDLDDGSLWIQFCNADDNLCVLSDPLPENPTDDYRSALDDHPAFRPDFYVVALPFDRASKSPGAPKPSCPVVSTAVCRSCWTSIAVRLVARRPDRSSTSSAIATDVL